MPSGVSWPRYIRMLGSSVLAMFAGAQLVHLYYLPDLVWELSTVVLSSVVLYTHWFWLSCCSTFFFSFPVICQSIPEVPPKPGELRTELLGYKLRAEATALQQKVDSR